MTTESYINKKYKTTHWPFIAAIKVISVFGEEGRAELNRLAAEGKIKRRKGINGTLVEIRILDDGTKLNEI